MFHEWRPLEIQIHRIGMRGALRPLRLSLNELGIQCIGEPRYDFVLHVEQIGDGFVEALGPKVSAAFDVDKLQFTRSRLPLRGVSADHERA